MIVFDLFISWGIGLMSGRISGRSLHFYDDFYGSGDGVVEKERHRET